MNLHKLLGIALIAFALPAAADLGPLDTTYAGGDGIVDVTPGCANCYVAESKLAARADGSVVLVTHSAVSSHHGIVAPHSLVVQRFLPSGVPDTSGNGPTTELPMGCCDFHSNGFALALQADGGILVAGSQTTSCQITTCTNVIGVSRLRADGTPDPTFGTAGRATTTLSGSVVAVGASADAKVVVAYTVYNGPTQVVRFTATGQIDTTYGAAGVASIGSNSTALGSAVVFADGSVVLAREREIMRLTPAGQPDPAFNQTGVREIARSPQETIIVGGLVAQGARLVVAFQNTGTATTVLQRLDSAGNDDTSFGPLGRREYPWYPGFEMTVDNQQRIVLLMRHDDPHPRATVRRLTAAGDIDTSWAPGGSLGIASAHEVWAVQVLPNSKAMIGYIFDFKPYFARIGDNALESDREFVLQQYRDLLSREGDSFGVAHWENQLANGTTRGQVILQFLQSPEFQGRIAPVMRLYLSYFLRFPDYAGLQFWVNYSASNPLTSISDAFASSDEFEARYGATTNAEYVQLVYQNVLGRAPDAAGAAFWENELNSGARTRGQVMLAFSESAEFQSTSFNEVQVAMTYAGMLRREPDAAGYDFWVGYMDAGNSAQALIDSFLNQPEYQGRFAP